MDFASEINTLGLQTQFNYFAAGMKQFVPATLLADHFVQRSEKSLTGQVCILIMRALWQI
jgi:hypothetical protein